MKVKIKDIAAEANVSMSAVSMALNNKPGISDKTRQKILMIAHEMDAKHLREKRKQLKSGTLRFLRIKKHGHCLNSDLDVFIASYIDGLEQESARDGYVLEVNNIESADLAIPLKEMARSSIDGMIVLGTELERDDLQFFHQFRIPIVFIDTAFNYGQFDFVTMNCVAAVESAVRCLYENGHREIGYLRSRIHAQNFILRDRGFEQAVQELGIRQASEWVFSVDSTFAGAYQEMRDILDKGARLPTALFCANDIMAYGCIKALREKGFRVPEDVSIIGFDNLPMSAHMDPPLTTIQVSKKEIGVMAVKFIINRLRDTVSAPSLNLMVSGSLVLRKSVCRLA